MTRVGRQVTISGLVQGVFFRAWTSRQARDLGVAGWVRNCPDGRVEARLSGEEAAVERLVALLHEGPPQARVDRIDVAPADPLTGEAFEVRS